MLKVLISGVDFSEELIKKCLLSKASYLEDVSIVNIAYNVGYHVNTKTRKHT